MKWYNSKDLIALYEVTLIQWKFTNQFGDPLYLYIDIVWRGLWKGYFALGNENSLSYPKKGVKYHYHDEITVITR